MSRHEYVFTGPSNVGRGVFAARDFAVGDRVLSFHGPEHPDPCDGSETEGYLLQIDVGRYILPDPPGRYVNHSCSPNVALVDSVDLVAVRAIAAGEEICFDYSISMEDDPFELSCACGSPACRGRVAEFGTLPDALRREYLARGWAPDFILARHGAAPAARVRNG